MSKWKITSQYIGGDEFYTVLRIKNPDEPMHAGNVEVAKGCIKDRAEAEKLCAELNKRD